MRIAVIGTGFAGRTLAGALAKQGHEITMGTRDIAITSSRTEPDRMGNSGFSVWAENRQDVRLTPFAEAAVEADLVINATSGSASLAALAHVGATALAGKVLWDISNPLDFTNGFPPALFVKDTDSLAEQIQREFPDAKVVKALNTVIGDLFTNPKAVANGDHTVFVSGDADDAKLLVVELLASFGWTDIVDLGGLDSARATEMLVQLRLRLMGILGTPITNFKIAR
ncbi:NAD(P)-binding domain-containing protein [Nocardia sp. BSTN01]|uniref:NADPH-dependent F420 reductase n=1 Tax=Nocardia sp. BSTN01 TaxID=2783665 RepID=UPI001890898E|nr:NAD(P)-binding domain-containing protein [Nocardia sp. BSTN01]MBF5001912.1 NAD(P)-binding domain-containing protein [Nocardia sp. BSTN01]